MLSMGRESPAMRDQVDQMRLEFHPDNPKIKLSILSFLLEAGVEVNPDLSTSVDAFNEAVREMAANVTAGYENYLNAGYALADQIEAEIKDAMSEAGNSTKPDFGRDQHEGDDGEDDGTAGLYL